MPKVIQELTIISPQGLHARPAAMFVQTALKYQCEIIVEKDGQQVDGKSIMALLTLAVGPNSKLKIYADGDDAQQAVDTLVSLLSKAEI